MQQHRPFALHCDGIRAIITFMNRLWLACVLTTTVSLGTAVGLDAPAEAKLFGKKKIAITGSVITQPAVTTGDTTTQAQVTTTETTTNGAASPEQAAGPVVVAPSTLVDLTTAKFGRLDVTLRDAYFLDADVRDLRLSAENMDMNKGTLDTLSIQVDRGAFEGFTVDSLRMWTRGALNFDVPKLLNDKVLQFHQPATANVRVSVTQDSLNKFLNAPFVLERLSGSARKRVPILSTLARQDVNFGFTFLKGNLVLEPENRVKLAMDSKLGMGKVGVNMALAAETKLLLSEGWVQLADTRLTTGDKSVPKDLAERIVTRINSLSKWGTQSDDIKFQFTDLNVVPNERLELQGTALINRLRFARNQGTVRTESTPSAPTTNVDKIPPSQPAPEQTDQN
jgi:hypothetical protein